MKNIYLFSILLLSSLNIFSQDCEACSSSPCYVMGPELVINGSFDVAEYPDYDPIYPYPLPSHYWEVGDAATVGWAIIYHDAGAIHATWTGTDHTTGTGNFLMGDGLNGHFTSL